MALLSEVLALHSQDLHLANVAAPRDGAPTEDHCMSLVTVMGMEFQTTSALTVDNLVSSVPKITVVTLGLAGSVMAAGLEAAVLEAVIRPLEAAGHVAGHRAGVPIGVQDTPREIAMEMGLQTLCVLTTAAIQVTSAPRTAVGTLGRVVGAAERSLMMGKLS